MGREYRLISADGHVIEPPDMWTKYLPKKFHDRAPKLVKDEKGGDAWELVPGTPPMPLGLVTNAGHLRQALRGARVVRRPPTTRSCRGAFEGKARIEEQDFDGVDAEVLFPSQRTMGAFMAQEDDDYHLAGLEAYNTWMHDEFMAADPERLIGLAQMPGVDIADLGQVAARRQGGRLPGRDHLGLPVGQRRAVRRGRPLLGGGRGRADAGPHPQRPAPGRQAHARARSSRRRPRSAGRSAWPRWAARSATHRSSCPSSSTRASSTASPTSRWWRWSAGSDGSRTSSSTWTTTTGATGRGPKSTLEMLPSEYFRRNWKATFIREPFAVATRHWIGVDNLMWSTDYPHHRHDWPYSRRIVEESMGGVPEAERRRMVCDNARELYQLG